MQRWRKKFRVLRKSPEQVAVSRRRRLSSVARPDQAVGPDWVGQWVSGLLLEQAPRAASACSLLALTGGFNDYSENNPTTSCADSSDPGVWGPQSEFVKQATRISAYCIQGIEQALFKALEHVKGGLETLREGTNTNQRVRGRMLYFLGGAVVKNPPPNAGDEGDLVSVPGLGRSPGEGNGNPLQYSCLENSMDQRSLAGYSPRDHKESDTTEGAHTHTHTHTHRGCFTF